MGGLVAFVSLPRLCLAGVVTGVGVSLCTEAGAGVDVGGGWWLCVLLVRVTCVCECVWRGRGAEGLSLNMVGYWVRTWRKDAAGDGT